MRRTAILFSIVVLLAPVTAQTQDTELVVVPAVAYGLPGFGDNLWTSEIYFTNPTSAEVRSRWGTSSPDTPSRRTPGTVVAGQDPGRLTSRDTAASDTRSVPICAWQQEAVGAYVFEVSEGMTISSRMINHDPEAIASCCPFLTRVRHRGPGDSP